MLHGLPSLQNWMCVKDPFSQIWSQIIQDTKLILLHSYHKVLVTNLPCNN